MKTYYCSNPGEMQKVASENLNLIQSLKKVAIYGGLGAGKTTLIKAICRCLEVEENVSSPTFGLVHEYFRKEGLSPKKVYHIDLYRLKSIEEALEIGIEDALYDESLCFIEWPELIEPILPESTLKISIELMGDSERKVIFL